MNKQIVTNMLPEHFNQHEKSGFFAPVFSFFTQAAVSLRTFRLFPGGAASVGPVNEARGWGNVRMSPELAMTMSAIWACVWRYAKTVSTLPLEVLQPGEDGVNVPTTTHPLYRLLSEAPNANMSGTSFWKGQVASLMSWGIAIAEKKYIGKQIAALDPWRPEYVTVYMDAGGFMRYRYMPPAGGGNIQRDVSADEVFVVLDTTMDGLTPLSRIQYGATSMGNAISAERAAAKAWQNGFKATGILTVAQWLKPEQRAAYKTIVNDFVGSGRGDGDDKQYGVMVAENATKFESLSLKPQDLELLDSRRFSVEDVCRWYDMPPILIGHASSGQTMWGSGVEQIILGWQKLSLTPLLRTIEHEISRQLLSDADRKKGIKAKFDLDELLRGDTAARTAFYSSMTQNGLMTRNEGRAKENLPPKEGGDDLTVQSSLILLKQLEENGAQPEPAVTQQDIADLKNPPAKDPAK